MRTRLLGKWGFTSVAVVLSFATIVMDDFLDVRYYSRLPADLLEKIRPLEIDTILLVVLLLGAGIIIDIRHARYLARLKKELANATSYRDRLFSIIAHDLRSFFNSLFCMTRLVELKGDKITPEEMRRSIRDLGAEGDKVYGLLTNLLEWALSQTKGDVLQASPIALKPLFEEMSQLFAMRLTQKELRLALDAGDDKLQVTADKEMLRAVLRNLLSNAVKFSRRGGTITLAAHSSGAGVVAISLRDTGVGVKAENLPRLFNIHDSFTTDGTESEKGTGVGLVICRDLVERNGGGIRCESEEGVGATFTVELPIAGPSLPA